MPKVQDILIEKSQYSSTHICRVCIVLQTLILCTFVHRHSSIAVPSYCLRRCSSPDCLFARLISVSTLSTRWHPEDLHTSGCQLFISGYLNQTQTRASHLREQHFVQYRRWIFCEKKALWDNLSYCRICRHPTEDAFGLQTALLSDGFCLCKG